MSQAHASNHQQTVYIYFATKVVIA